MTKCDHDVPGGLWLGPRLPLLGYGATPPLVRLLLSEQGVKISSRWWWLSPLIPTLEFPWTDLLSVAESSDALGFWLGVRFDLAAEPSVSRGWLIAAPLWGRSIRRPVVLLRQTRIAPVLATARHALASNAR